MLKKRAKARKLYSWLPPNMGENCTFWMWFEMTHADIFMNRQHICMIMLNVKLIVTHMLFEI